MQGVFFYASIFKKYDAFVESRIYLNAKDLLY